LEGFLRNHSVTSVTIAHRLQTVIGNNRVLVLDKGCVEEFGSTVKFTEKKDGKLFQMIRETGKASSIHLIALAEAAAKQNKSHLHQDDEDDDDIGLDCDFELNKTVI
jgi:ABC-type methionine transport system ATPase subunit